MPTTPETRIYTIPTANKVKFLKSVSFMNNKALKLQVPEIVTSFSNKRMELTRLSDCADGAAISEHLIEVEDVSVSVTPIRLEGWVFRCLVETVDAKDSIPATKVFHGVKTDDIPAQYRTQTTECEHCQTNRVRRNLFIVSHAESGEFKQVGSACSKSFFDGHSPEKLVQMFEFQANIFLNVQELSEEANTGSYGVSSKAVFTFEKAVELSIRIHNNVGFTSAKPDEYEPSNKIPNKTILSDWNTDSEKEFPACNQEEVATLLEWIDAQEDSDFFKGVRAYKAVGLVSQRGLGLIACLPHCRSAQIRREIKLKIQAETAAKSNFVGIVGERIVVTATCTRVINFETDFGYTHMCLMQDAEGNVIKTGALNCSEGETVTFKGTVTDHSVYRDTKQTVMKRCRFYEEKAKAPKLKLAKAA